MRINGIALYRTTKAGWCFHAHPYYQLHFNLSGVDSYEIAGRRAIKARPELFFVVPPNHLHRISLPGNRPLLEYLIDMAPEADDDPVKKLMDIAFKNKFIHYHCIASTTSEIFEKKTV